MCSYHFILLVNFEGPTQKKSILLVNFEGNVFIFRNLLFYLVDELCPRPCLSLIKQLTPKAKQRTILNISLLNTLYFEHLNNLWENFIFNLNISPLCAFDLYFEQLNNLWATLIYILNISLLNVSFIFWTFEHFFCVLYCAQCLVGKSICHHYCVRSRMQPFNDKLFDNKYLYL